MSKPSILVRLYGTDEEVAKPKLLRAGPLTAELEAGNLRHIKFVGTEVMRAISFIVRDKDWGTYNPIISDLKVTETADGFQVAYNAVAKDGRQEFRYRATITGSNQGVIFRARGEAVSDFLTNRTGFVVLHPIAGVAGRPVEIEHTDGRVVKTRFPDLIDPIQPMMDLRCLIHEAAPGLRVACRMEGDIFEMEDQRNWTDASYKTYVRPLALPWPYTLEAGTQVEQSITLAISGLAPAVARSGDQAISLALGGRSGPAPALGLGLDPDEVPSTMSAVEPLTLLRPHHLICHYDPRRGHDARTLAQAAAIAASLGSEPWLEAVVTRVDGFENEIARLGGAVAGIGSPFSTVLLSPASDLKCTLPGSPWPPAPPADEMFRSGRHAFPTARLGGGMFSFFTEMNRKRPPLAEIDLVSFTTSALVHAGDDHSVMEGLESLPAIAASALAIAGKLPIAVGPSAIGFRMNPYGEAPMDNPRNTRQAMNRNDPRQRGLLCAAWTVAYYAHFARSGFAAIAFGGTTGASGAVYTRNPWPAPWYDEGDGRLFPVYHALRGLARLSGKPMRELDISSPSTVQGICVEDGGTCELWIANLTPDPQRVVPPAAIKEIAILDSSGFVAAASAAQYLDDLTPPSESGIVALAPFAVARIRLA
jgi:hypothetical protein